MKTICAILCALIFLPILVSAVPDNVTTGPHNISFDIGSKKSDYSVTLAAPKTVESLGGDERTDYSIDIIDKTDKSKFIKITIKKALKASPIATADVLETALKLNNVGDSRISGLQTATRNIDETSGAIASAHNNLASVTVYQALYQPMFDPTHIMVELISTYPWEEGTLQLLKTIHVEKVNQTL